MVRYIHIAVFLDLRIIHYSKTRPLCFRSRLCPHIQVKIPILFGLNPEFGISPFYQNQQNRHFCLKIGTEPAPETWSRFTIFDDG